MASKNKKLNIAAGIFEQNLEGTIRKISLQDIIPSKGQPRQNKEINIEGLASSLKEEGLLQPIVVTKKSDKYVIIAGERRFRAASSLGWTEIECRILHKDEKDTYRLAVIENLQRENFEPLEEAHAYKKLKNEYNYTDQELSGILGKSRNYISEILSIAELPPKWQKQAEEAGLNNKNILVQLALAVKSGNGETFLAQVESGSINTVREAKQFNQTQKAPAPSGVVKASPEKPPIAIRPKFTVKSRQDKTGDTVFTIHFSGIHLNEDQLDVLQKKFRNDCEQILAKP